MHFLQRLSQDKGVDLEAWEEGLRTAVLSAGAGVLERLLHEVGRGRRVQPVVCPCGQAMRSRGLREKTVQTILGPIRFERSLYVCAHCGASRFPGDEVLGVQGSGFSPGLRRMMARAGSRTSFAEAEEDLQVYAALQVHRKDIERVAKEVGQQVEAWMAEQRDQAIGEAADPQRPGQGESIPVMYVSFDGTGVPMRPEALQGRKGKQPDGGAKTREAKLGCVFTQTTTDDQGRAVREPHSTTYAGAIESSDDFGWRIYAEARTRGLERAEKVVLLTDGANYNKSILEMHFPGAIHIIDLYHAREHLYNASKLLLFDSERAVCEAHWLELLDEGQIEQLLQAMGEHLPPEGDCHKAALKEMEYFSQHAEQMRYADFKRQGLFIGSGVIEAACRTLIGQRLKKSGMFWSLPGANAIIALRCCQFSARFDTFWENAAA